MGEGKGLIENMGGGGGRKGLIESMRESGESEGWA